jgi:ubiquinone/menaquinone biosynthesis C-methylase UbiE
MMTDMQNEHKETFSAEGYDRVACEVFLPLFPVIARKALDIYGRDEGVCLDIGSGGGMFGYNVALQSKMSVHFLDIQPDAIDICMKRGREWGLASRSSYAVGDVHAIPLPSDTYPLIVSRGSIKFWGNSEELRQAFCEIYRVLSPGGKTLIGNSLGPPEMEAAITEKMRTFNPEWRKSYGFKGIQFTMEERSVILLELAIPHRLIEDESGSWIVMQK